MNAVYDSNLELRRPLSCNTVMPSLKPSLLAASDVIRRRLSAGTGHITNRFAVSEVLAVANLFLTAAIYPFIAGRIVSTIQLVIIPVVLVATVGFAARGLFHPKTRLHSAVALVLSLPVAFLYFVWRGWIRP